MRIGKDIFEKDYYLGFPGGSEGKASPCNVGDPGWIPGLGRSPGEGNGQPTPVLLPGKLHGRRSLVDDSPWGRRVGHDWVTSLHFIHHSWPLTASASSAPPAIPYSLQDVLDFTGYSFSVSFIGMSAVLGFSSSLNSFS